MATTPVEINASLAGDLAKIATAKGLSTSDVIHAHALFVESIEHITDNACKTNLRLLLQTAYANSTVYEGEIIGQRGVAP